MGISFPPLAELGRRWSGTATLFMVLAGIALLFTTTGLLARSWKRQRLSLAGAQFAAGEKLASSGKYEGAIDHYLSALDLSRNDQRYELALALALLRLKRTREAETYLSETLAADPTNARANLAMARIAAANNDIAKAVLYYHRAGFGLWNSDPVSNRIHTRLELADFLVDRGRTRQALGELIELESEAPGDRALHLELAYRYLRYKVPDEAAKLFREVIAEGRDDPAAWTGLGEAESARGNYKAAEAALRQALRLEPRDPDIQARLRTLEDVLSIDPSVRLLSTKEQYRRSRVMLQRASESMSQCVEDMPHVPPPAQGALAASRTLLDHAVRRPRAEDVRTNLSALSNLWKARLSSCPKSPVKDEALAMVMGRLP